MNMLRFSLNSVGGWPYKVFSGHSMASRVSTAFCIVLIVLTAAMITSTVMYLQRHLNSDLEQSYINILIGCVCFQRLFLPFQRKYCLVVKQFILEFHMIHCKHKTDFAAKEYERVKKICTIVSVVCCSQVFLVVILVNMMPLYNNIQTGMFTEDRNENNTFQHPVDYELPFDQYTTNRGYFIVFAYNWYAVYYVASVLCGFDLLVFIMVFHIWGHLNILIHDLKYFSHNSTQNSEDSKTQPTQEDFFVRLKEVVSHHQIIKEFMTNTSEAFSTTLCFYLIFHQLSGCVLLLKCSSLDPVSLGRYGMMTFLLTNQLIQTSVIFEFISSKGDSLVDVVYALPWEHMDGRNRRIVLMFLRNVQTSLALKAGGMVPVGVLTMSAILKTSCSYFLMLRTLDQ